MSNSYFSFKLFTVSQARSAMRVGTDGVLLGAWCGVERPSGGTEARPWLILDVGSGTGLIALMAAQREPQALVDALEPDEGSCCDAAQNFSGSPWRDRLTLHRGTLQEFAPGRRYDRIVSNPPYFVNSLLSPDPAKTAARHTASLPYADLLDGVTALIASEGLFSVILPLPEGVLFEGLALERGLYCVRKLTVRTTPNSPPKRVLMEFSLREAPLQHEVLVMETDVRGEYSEAYKRLTRDFYLKF